jgi:SAM-dependent methyltransferase
VDLFSADAVRAGYDVAADDYARTFGDDLAELPLDREMLDTALAAASGLDGWVLEAGCGPAPAASYFGDRAPRLVGLDLSGQMLRVAGERNPGLARVQADLRALALPDRSCAVATAYYCLQHLPREDLGAGLAELHRVVASGGVLLLATHLGDEVVQSDEFLGHKVQPFAGILYPRETLLSALATAGFEVEQERQRGPLPNEHQSQRIYLLARR